MDRRIETRVIETGRAALTTIIQREASTIWWITISTKTNNTESLLTIHDGFDGDGKVKWRHQLFTSAHFNFVPPIPCEEGITIVNNANVEYYTVAYRARKWDRPKPMKADEIKHPDA